MSGENTQGESRMTTGAPPASHAALPKGTRLQEFQVVEVIGEGGFGIVYLADDMQLHRAVAVKEYMPASLASRGDGETVVVRSEQNLATFQAGMRSFIAEARMLAQFKHPALVEVLRFWEQHGTAYMAMPYYKGRTLRQVLHDDAHLVDERWLKTVFAPVMDALELMHAQNVYHRDVAPDNILILGNGAPVLLDLGAARRIIGDLTQAVTVVLKPGYAPVEQYADDGSATQGPWTDVYAIGAVLYFAITGRPPVASVSRIMKDTLKPLDSAAYPGYSDDFLAGIGKALAVKPEDRPRSIAELREVLGVSSYAATTMMPPVTVSTAMRDRAAATATTTITSPATSPATATSAKPPVTSAVPSPVPASVKTEMPAREPTRPVEPGNGNVPETGGRDALDALFQGDETDEDVLGVQPQTVMATATGAEAPGKTTGTATESPSRATASRPAATEKSGKSSLPLLILGLLFIGAIGGAAYLFMGSDKPAEPAVQPSVAQAPTVAAPPEQPPTPAPAPAEPAAPHVEPAPVAPPPPPVVAPPEPPARHEPVPVPTNETAKAPTASAPEKPADSSPSAQGEGKVRFALVPWGEVWVDGVKRGPSPPLKSLKLSVGSHRIELRNPGLPSVMRKVEVKKGETITIEHHFSGEAGGAYGGL
jgi:non-specific serine/threonine protein kinase